MRSFGQKGFSLTEIVISMSLVVVISAIGFLACVLSIRISSGSDIRVKGYNEAEMFELSLSSAYNSIGGDYNKKDEFVDEFMQNLEWYFEVDGLAESVSEQDLLGDEWTVEIPIKYGEETDEDGNKKLDRYITVYYYGATKSGLASYSYLVTVFDVLQYTECNVNCRTADFSALLKGWRNNSNIAFYEKELHYTNV